MHLVIEKVLRGEIVLNSVVDRANAEHILRSANVSDKEIANCIRYCRRLLEENIHQRLLGLELNLEVQINGVPLLLGGHIDALARAHDNGMLIIDHKTNRSAEPMEVWRARIQPLVYAVLVAAHAPTVPSIRVRIGYVNLGHDVEWAVQPEETEWLRNRFKQAYDEMAIYDRHDEWPERLNGECQYCPLLKDCATMQSSLQLVHGALTPKKLDRSPAGRMLWLTHVLDAGQLLMDEAKASTLEAALTTEAAGGPAIEVGDHVVTIKRSKRRQIPFGPAHDAVIDAMTEHPESREELRGMLGDVFSVKVTGADAVGRRWPELGERFAAATQEVVGEPSVSLRPKKKGGVK